MMLPGEAPGLGVDIDEAKAAQYPYERAYLPVARLLDGTIHSW
jgi:mannonate dehydratase